MGSCMSIFESDNDATFAAYDLYEKLTKGNKKMTATISTLPVWKAGASAAEWLEELAALARESPEKWRRIAVVFEELNSDGLPFKTRIHSYNHEHNTGIIGALEVAKLDLWEFMNGRQIR